MVHYYFVIQLETLKEASQATNLRIFDTSEQIKHNSN